MSANNPYAKKILIADDEPAFCLLLKSRLAPLQHEIITASDGQEAMDKILQEKPGLLILDVMMPKMNGYQLVQKLNTVPDLVKNMSVIVMSANHKMKEFFNSWETVAFLPKPFEAEELIFRVNQALQDASLRIDPKRLHQENIQKETSGTETKKKVLVAGKSEFAITKAKELMESLGLAVAVEMEDHYAIKAAENSKFDFILCQFWEDSSVFDAVKVYNEIKAMPHLQSVPFALFCISALAIDAKQAIEKIPIIPFAESADLKQGIHEVLRRKAVLESIQ